MVGKRIDMDELGDFEKKAKREYEGISQSREDRMGKIDLSKLSAIAFISHLANDTQIIRAMHDWCHSVEFNINVEYLSEDVHFEFFEGDMTNTEIVEGSPMIFLDRRKFFESIIVGIEIWLDGKDSEDEHERKESGLS